MIGVAILYLFKNQAKNKANNHKMTAYLAKNRETDEYCWRSGWGCGGYKDGVEYTVVDVDAPTDLMGLDEIIPVNLTLDEKIFWMNQQSMEVYEKFHITYFLLYNKYTTCVELRKIIRDWNNKRRKDDRIKGVSKMLKEELVKIAQGGKYQ